MPTPDPIEVIKGTINEPISLRAELHGKSMVTIAEFEVSGQEVVYVDRDMPFAQERPVRQDFQQHDFVIVAGTRRTDGRLSAIAIEITQTGEIIGTSPNDIRSIVWLSAGVGLFFALYSVFVMWRDNRLSVHGVFAYAIVFSLPVILVVFVGRTATREITTARRLIKATSKQLST